MPHLTTVAAWQAEQLRALAPRLDRDRRLLATRLLMLSARLALPTSRQDLAAMSDELAELARTILREPEVAQIARQIQTIAAVERVAGPLSETPGNLNPERRRSSWQSLSIAVRAPANGGMPGTGARAAQRGDMR